METSSSAPFQVSCPRCNGTGSCSIGERLLQTLVQVADLGGATTSDLCKNHGGDIGQTAFNNRLEDLRKLGLVSRRKKGRTWVYSVPRHIARQARAMADC